MLWHDEVNKVFADLQKRLQKANCLQKAIKQQKEQRVEQSDYRNIHSQLVQEDLIVQKNRIKQKIKNVEETKEKLNWRKKMKKTLLYVGMLILILIMVMTTLVSAAGTTNGTIISDEVVVDTKAPIISNIAGTVANNKITIIATIEDPASSDGIAGSGVNTSVTKYAITLTKNAPAEDSEEWKLSNVFSVIPAAEVYAWVKATDNVGNTAISTTPATIKVMEAFITEWTVPASATITLPIPVNTINNYVVDWGDGKVEEYDSTANFPTHKYTTANTYTIKISGTVREFGFFGDTVPEETGDNANYYSATQYITKLVNWGEIGAYRYSFQFCTNLAGTIPSPKENTFENTYTMARLFNGCSKLTGTIPADLFNNAIKVSDFTFTFKDCTGLEGAIPSELFTDSTSATSVYGVFMGCSGLTEVPADLFNKNTAIKNFGYTFHTCTGITEIPASIFSQNTEALYFDYTFFGCTKLSSIPQGLFTNNTKAQKFNQAFNGCTGLKGSIPTDLISHCPDAEHFAWMFSECSGLTGSIPDGFFANRSKTTTFAGVFFKCSGLEGSIPANLFDNCTAVTSYQQAFYDCRGLTGVIPRELFEDSPSASTFNYTFYNCTGLEYGEVIINTTDSVSMQGIFQNCTGLKSLVLSEGFKHITSKNMFSGCSNLKAIIMLNDAASETEVGTLGALTTIILPSATIIYVPTSEAETNYENAWTGIIAATRVEPLLKLVGNETVEITYGETYTDEGYTVANNQIANKGEYEVYGFEVAYEDGEATDTLGSKVRTYTLTKANGTTTTDIDSVERTIKVNPIDFTKAEVTLAPTTFGYDGTEKEPAITVTLNDLPLVLGSNYSVSYDDNINAGTVTVTITGANAYSGTITKTFTITKASPELTANPTSGKTIPGQTIEFELTHKGNGTLSILDIDESKVEAVIEGTTLKVTGVTEGTTEITVKIAAGTNHAEATVPIQVTISKGNYSVNGVHFETFRDAYDSIETSEGIINVEQDNTDSKYIEIEAEKTITLNMNGHTITRVNVSDNEMGFYNHGTFIVDGGGTITTLDAKDNSILRLIQNTGTLTLKDVEIVNKGIPTTNEHYWEGVLTEGENSKLTIDGATIRTPSRGMLEDYSTQKYGARTVQVSGGTLVILSGNIINESDSKGYALENDYMEKTIIRISGGTLTSNYRGISVGNSRGNDLDVLISGGTVTATEEAIVVNNGYAGTKAFEITGGKLVSTNNFAINNPTTSSIVIGDASKALSTEVPEIVGNEYAIRVTNGFNFNSGVLKGTGAKPYIGTPALREGSYYVKTTGPIDGVYSAFLETDEAGPEINVSDAEYPNIVKMTMVDTGSGLSYWGITDTENAPTITTDENTTAGSELDKWFLLTTSNNVREIAATNLNAGTYYAWAKDALGNITSAKFEVTQATPYLNPSKTSISLYVNGSQTISYAYNGDASDLITASSSDDKKATVEIDTTNKTVTINAIAEGNAEITLNAPAKGNYKEQTATINVAIGSGNYRVNGKYYDTLGNAYNAITEDEGTIEVIGTNIYDYSWIEIAATKKVTIEMNGNTIIKARSSSVAMGIYNKGSLTIKGGGTITTMACANNKVSRIIQNEGTLVLEDVELINKGYNTDGADYWQVLLTEGANASVTIDGATLKTVSRGITADDTTTNDGARVIAVKQGKLEILSGNFIEESDTSGYVLEHTYSGATEIRISGGTFTSDDAGFKLGAGNGTDLDLVISGGTIESNDVAIAINSTYVGTKGVEITGGTVISHNTHAIYNGTTASIIIGSETAELSTEQPAIIGKGYGVHSANGFNFNNGVIKGENARPYYGTPDLRDGSYFVKTTGPVDSVYSSYLVLDEESPEITVTDVEYPNNVNITMQDTGAGLTHWAVATTTSEPTTTADAANTTGNVLNQWYPVANTTASTALKFTGLKVGKYYAYGKDAIGNVSYKEFKVTADPILMAESYEDVKTNNYILGNAEIANGALAITRDKVKTITIIDTSKESIPANAVTTWDVSKNNNGSVIAGLVQDTNEPTKYNLYIGGYGGVTAYSGYSLFSYYTSCISIDGLNKLDTSIATTFANMFAYSTALTALDLESFKTEKVENMAGVFIGCSGLTEIKLSNFNTSKVTNFSSMFQDCINLLELNVSKFDTTSAINMNHMFYNCNKLETIKVDDFKTSNVESMTYMFGRCSAVKELNVSNFDTTNVTSFKGMFQDCGAVTTLDVDEFKTGKVANFSCMFQNCTGLTSLDVSNFDTSAAKEMVFMFENCSALTSLDLSSFDTTGLDGSNSGYSYAINGEKVFAVNVDSLLTGCTNLETVLLGSKFDRIDGRYMFNKDSKLKSIIAMSQTPMQILNDNGELADNRLNTITAVIYVPTEEVEALYEADSNYASKLNFTANTDSARVEPILSLVGEKEITIEPNGTYEEVAKVAGYTSVTGTDITPVKVKEYGFALTRESDVVLSTPDKYEVTYTLTLDGEEVDTVTRNVIVADWSNAIITEWTISANADGDGNGTTVRLPIPANYSNNYVVDWGDGTVETYTSEAFPSHEYKNTAEETYTVRISGTVKHFGYVDFGEPGADSEYSTFVKYLTKLVSWGEVEAERYAFAHCRNLAGAIPAPQENTFKATKHLSLLFYNCESLEGPIPGNLFDNALNIEDASYLFSECKNLTGSIPEGLFDNFGKVTDFAAIFNNCEKLEGPIPYALFDNCTNVETFSYAFAGTTNLSGSIPNGLFASSNKATRFMYVFYNSGVEGQIPQDLFDGCTEAIDFGAAFQNCKGLTGPIPANLFEDCTKAERFGYAFYGCSGLTGIVPAELFKNCNNIKNMSYTFANASSLEGVELNVNTSNIQDFGALFENCSSLETVIFGEKIEKIDGYYIFQGCTELDAIIMLKNAATTSEVATLDPIDKIGLPAQTIIYVSNEEVEDVYEEAWNGIIADTRVEPILSLVGDKDITLRIGQTYEEAAKVAGYSLSADADITPAELKPYGYALTKVGEVNLTALGKYEVTYTLTLDGAEVDTVTRTVNVIDWSNALITEWTIPANADSDGTGTTIALPIPEMYTNNYYVDWGDGVVENYGNVGYPTHEYTEGKTYTIRIAGNVDEFGNLKGDVLDSNNPAESMKYITGLISWGEINTRRYSFAYCENLASTIPEPTENSFTNVETTSVLFKNCSKLTGIIPSNLFTKATKTTEFISTFENCSSLSGSIPEGLFATNVNATKFNSVFNGAGVEGVIPAELFTNNKGVTEFSYAFANCSKLTEIEAGLFDENKDVTLFNSVFENCSGLTSIPAGLFAGQSKAENFRAVFYNCQNIASSIPADLFDGCSAITTFEMAFKDSNKISGAIPATLFEDSVNATNFSGIFENCAGLEGDIPAGLFKNNTKVENIRAGFMNCTGLTGGEVLLDTTNVTNADLMFWNCSNMTTLILGENFKKLDAQGEFGANGKLNAIIMLNDAASTSEVATLGALDTINLPAQTIIYVSNEAVEAVYEEAWDGIIEATRVEPLLALEGSEIVEISVGQTYTEDGYKVAGYNLSNAAEYAKYGYAVTYEDSEATYDLGSFVRTYTLTRNVNEVEEVIDTEERTIKVNAIDLTDAVVTLNPKSFEFDGTAKEPAIAVTLNNNPVAANGYTVSYDDNINAGTVTVTITGKNAYTGKATATFEITKASPVLTATPSSVGLKVGGTAEVEITYKGNGSLDYYTEESAIATATLNGNKITVTGTGTGTTNIVVTVSEGDNYRTETLRIPVTVGSNTIIVTPKPNQGKDFGEADPKLDYTFVGNLTGEQPGFTGALTREPGEKEGTYAITLGTLALADTDSFKASNYNLVLSDEVVNFTIKVGVGTLITEWTIPANADSDGTGTTIALPIPEMYTNNYYVDWGDGVVENYGNVGYPTHEYTEGKTYTIRIAGNVDEFGNLKGDVLDSNNPAESMKYITGLISWGEINTRRYSFAYCENLASTIPEPTENSFTNVETTSVLFKNCSKLTGIIPSNLFTKATKTTEFISTFENCSSLSGSIPEGLFATNVNATKFNSVFNGAGVEGVIPAELFTNNKGVTEFSYAFANCSKLTEIEAGLFDENKDVTLFNSVFENCSGLTSIPAGLFAGQSKAENFRAVFYNCQNIASSIPADLFDGCSAITTFEMAFKDSNKISGAIPATLFEDSVNATNFSGIFENCAGLEGDIPAGLFKNNTKVENIRAGFMNCTGLTGGEVLLDTTNVTNADLMFWNCSNMTTLILGENFKKLDAQGEFGANGKLNAIIMLNDAASTSEVATLGALDTINLPAQTIIYVSNEAVEAVYEEAWDGIIEATRVEPLLALEGSEIVEISVGQTYTEDGYKVAGYNLSNAAEYAKYGYAVTYEDSEATYDLGSFVRTYTLTRNVNEVEEVIDTEERTIKVNAIDLTDAVVTLNPKSFEFDGTAKEPAIAVTLNNNPVAANGYTVSYDDNINAGTVTVTITGKNAYTGKATATFEITNAKLNVTAEDYTVTYDGKAHGINVEVTGVTDAKITYGTQAGTYDLTANPTYTEKGTYTVYYKVEKANYDTVTGSATVTITAKDIASTDVKVTLDLESFVFDGTAKLPEITIHDETVGKDLVLNTDYTFVCENNITVGTKTITFTGKENYTGTRTATFEITNAKLNVTAEDYTVTYDGKAHGITLSGIEEATVTYGTEAGKYELTVNPTYTEKGIYTVYYKVEKANYDTVTGEATVTITAKDIASTDVKVTLDRESFVFDGTAKLPEITIHDETVGKDLVLNTDYTFVCENNITVGTKTITFTGKENYTGTRTATFEITNATLGVVATDYTGVYDGKAHGITLSGIEGATVTYGTQTGTYDLTANPTYTEKGTYTVYYKVEKANYATVTGDATVTISAKDINDLTISLTQTTFDYDGKAKEPKATIVFNGENLIEDTDYTIDYEKNTDAGQAAAIIKGKENFSGTKTVYFTINKAKLDVTASGFTGQYDGKAHEINVTAKGITDVSDAKITYAETAAKNYTETEPTYKDVGTYTVYYKVEKANYDSYEGSAVVTITAKVLNVEWSNTTLIYNATAQKPTAKVTNDVTDEEVKLNVTGEKTAVGENYEANVSISSVTNGKATNYGLSNTTTKFNIVLDENTAFDVSLDKTSVTYDGTKHTPIATVTTTVAGKTVTLVENTDYTVDYGENINAGTGTVIITGTGNYKGVTATQSFTINKAVITVTPKPGQYKVYGDADPKLDYSSVGAIGSEEVGFTGSLTRNSGDVVGSYAITQGTLALADTETFKKNNYTLEFSDNVVNFVITAKNIKDAVVTVTPNSYTYDGTEKKPSVAVTLDKTVLSGASAYSVGYSDNVNVGTATVTVTGTGNYTGTATGTFTITEATLTVKGNGYTGTYDGASHGITVDASGVTDVKDAIITYGEEAGTYNLTSSPTYKNKGEYTVYFKVSMANYKDATGSAKVVINPKSVGVVWTDTELTFNNGIQAPKASADSGIAGETINLRVDGGKKDVGGPYTATASIESVKNGEVSNYTLTDTTTQFNIKLGNVSFDVDLEDTQYTYIGKAHTPTAIVKTTIGDKEVALTKDVDYTVAYANNVNAGEATVTITGIGNYKGVTKPVTFTIAKNNLTVTPTPGQKKNVGESDPALTYIFTGNISGETPGITGKLERVAGEEPGKYAINQGTFTIVDNGDFKVNNYNFIFDNEDVYFTILDPNDSGSSDSDFEIIEKEVEVVWTNTILTFNGMPQKPTAEAKSKIDGETIILSVTGEQTNIGTYTATAQIVGVTGGQNEINNYTLKNATTTFKIIADTGIKFNVSLDKDSFVYTGEAHEPAVTVKVDSNGTETSLTEGTHFRVEYKNNVNAGTATVTVIGLENYDGTETAENYTITKRDFTVTPNSGGKVYGTDDPTSLAYKYTGNVNNEIPGFSGSLSREVGEDVGSYAINLGTFKLASTSTFNVNNYNLVFSSEVVYFTITPKNIAEIAVTMNPSTVPFDGLAKEPDAVMIYNGNTLAKDRDFEIIYENNTNAGQATAKITGKGNFTGTTEGKFTISQTALAISASGYSNQYDGKSHGITLSGTGLEGATVWYGSAEGVYETTTAPTYKDAGDYTVYFKVDKENFDSYTGSAVVSISKKDVIVRWSNTQIAYDGTSKLPTAEAITGVANETITLNIDGAQKEVGGPYTATASIASVTNGKGSNYNLTETTTEFNIVLAGDLEFKVDLGDTEFTYNGEEQTTTVTVSLYGRVLEEGTDYKVEYSNNKNFGTATITITGLGTYANIPEAIAHFTIKKADLVVKPNSGQSKVYGENDPELKYTPSGAIGLEEPDFSGSLERAEGENVGTYAINKGTLALIDNNNFIANNYNLVFSNETVNFTITAKDLAGAKVSTDPTSYTFDGTAKQPTVTVTLDGKTLALGSDYSVSYDKNVNVGTAIVTVTAKENSNYKGSATGTFTITNAGLNVTATGYSDVYDGKYHGITINEITGATIKYGTAEGNCNLTSSPTFKDVGENTVYFKVSKSNYDDFTGSAKVIITPKEAKVTWTNTDLTFNNAPQKPTATAAGVTGETINLNVDGAKTDVGGPYTATASIASVTNGKATNYTLSDTTCEFTIKVDTSIKFNVTLDKSEFTYDGTEHKPTPTVKVTFGGNTVTLDSDDYDFVHSNNINVANGTTKPTVTITGKGNYDGITETINFTINKRTLTVTPTAGLKKEFSYADPAFGYSFNGQVSGEKPEFSGALARTTGETVGTYAINKGTLALIDNDKFIANNYNLVVTSGITFEIVKADIGVGTLTLNPTEYKYNETAREPETTVVVNNKTLVRDRDYTVLYKDNVEIGFATATVTGKGNYKGTLTATFEILRTDIGSGTISLTPITFEYDGMEKRPIVTIVCEGRTLIVNADYELRYYENINVGKNTAYVIATGVGKYRGELKGTFSITPRKLAGDIKLSQNVFEYDGSEKKPTVTFIMEDGSVLFENVDFKVEYQNNFEVGTATVTVTGIGNYEGTLSTTFDIVKAQVKITLKDKTALYTGNEVAIDEAVLENTTEDLSSYIVYKYYAEYQLEEPMKTLPKDIGVYYVEAELKDHKDYNEAISNRVTLVIYGAPTKPTITVKDSEGILDSGEKTKNPVEVTISGSKVPNVDTVEFGYKYSLDGTTWKEYTGPIDITTQGTTTIYAKAYLKEKESFESEEITFTITIDNTAPTIDDVIIPDVVDSVVTDVEVKGDDIYEVFITEDPTQDPDEEDWMKVGEDGKTVIELSQGDGEKPVYVWVRDEAGNISGPVQETITLSALKIGNQNDNKTTIMFKLTDKYLHTANIATTDIAIYVNGILSQGKITNITREAIENGYRYIAIMEDVTGDGELSLEINTANVYDKAGNKLTPIKVMVDTNEITVDNTLPTVNVSTSDNKVFIIANDANMKAVMLNGEVLGRVSGQYTGELKDGVNKVVVIDEYGNEVIQELSY